MCTPLSRARRPAAALAARAAVVLVAVALAAGTAAAQDDAVETAPATAEAPAPTDAAGEVSMRRSLAWVAVGAAAAFATTSGILALAAESREDDLAYLIDVRDRMSGAPAPYQGDTRDYYEELTREGDRLSLAARVTVGLAAASLATAVGLFVLDATGADEAAASARITPHAGPDGAGVTLGWEF
ncbi:hypothetical protein [Haliangium sp.]|uniref:hypothetical protein n=1 Tax=Haliangium sp. TaxID=2663208 RepID=UPI003D0EAA38